MIKTALVSLAIATTMAASPGAQADTSRDSVASALGKSGTVMPGEIYRVGMPRTDLHVKLDCVELKPTLVLGSWVAYGKAKKLAVKPQSGEVIPAPDR
jgi:hypothetical protein